MQAFDYDQWGNRTINQTLTTTSSDINKKLFTVNTANNRLGVPSRQPTNIKMEYDGVGNLTNDTWTNPSAGGAMEYDAENHMTSAVNGAHQYRYNADGKRTRRIIASVGEFWMVYGIGGELVAEYNATSGYPTAGSPTKEFGYRNGQMLVMGDTAETDANLQFKWLVQDHLGSTRMEIGKDGTAVVRHDYLPFGEELAGTLRSGNGYGTTTKTKQKFTGHERDDETGLDFMQARYYASVQGRFIIPDDPLAGGDRGDPQTWNLYAYTSNNPLNRIDPDGERWFYKQEGNSITDIRWVNPNADGSYTSPGDGYIEFIPTPSKPSLEVYLNDGKQVVYFGENKDGSPYQTRPIWTGKVESGLSEFFVMSGVTIGGRAIINGAVELWAAYKVYQAP